MADYISLTLHETQIKSIKLSDFYQTYYDNGLYTLMICYLILTRSGRVIFINEKV